MRFLKLVLLLASAPVFASSFTLKSKNFKHEGEIPSRFTCRGEGISPQLSWSGAPKETQAYALIVDSPESEESAFWVVYNLPHAASSLGEGVKALPPGAQQGFNAEKERGYLGPCPKADGSPTIVRFKLYALDGTTRFFAPPVRQDLEKAIQNHILAQTELVGRVTKPSDPNQ